MSPADELSKQPQQHMPTPRFEGVILFIMHIAAAFSHIFSLGLGFWICFFFFSQKEKNKRSVSLQGMWNTWHVEGENGLFLMESLLFDKLQTTMPLG